MTSCPAVVNYRVWAIYTSVFNWVTFNTKTEQTVSDCGVDGQTVKIMVYIRIRLFPDLSACLPISQPVGWPPYTCLSVCSLILAACLSVHLSVSSSFCLNLNSHYPCSLFPLVSVLPLLIGFSSKIFPYSYNFKFKSVKFKLRKCCLCPVSTIQFADCSILVFEKIVYSLYS